MILSLLSSLERLQTRVGFSSLVGQKCRGNSHEDSHSSGIMVTLLERKVLAAEGQEMKAEDSILGRWVFKNLSLSGRL